MRQYSIFLLFIAYFGITSCGNDDPAIAPIVDDGQGQNDDGPIISNGEAFSLILQSSSEDNVVTTSESVTFSAFKNDGTNISSEVNLEVNQIQIQGTTHTFASPGVFEVVAHINGVFSNKLVLTVISPNDRVLRINRMASLRNQEVIFTLVNADGEMDPTAIFYIDGNQIPTNNFSSSVARSYLVRADYLIDGVVFSTEATVFDIIVPKRKVLIEDYTATWCGFCPQADVLLDELQELTNDVVITAIHVEDEMGHPDEPLLRNFLEINSWPSLFYNRTERWNENFSQILTQAGTDTHIGISIESHFVSPTSINMNIEAISETPTFSNKIIIYLLEDGVIYDQKNYLNNDETSPWYQAGDPILNFEHNHVLRTCFTNIFGDPIPARDALDVYRKNYNFAIPSQFRFSNLSMVVIVTDNFGQAINAQVAPIGDKKPYE